MYSVITRSSIFRILALLLTAVTLAPAQELRFGIVGGTNLTRSIHDQFDSAIVPMPDGTPYQIDLRYFSRSHTPILGPSLEVSLPAGFSIEADALHRTLQTSQLLTTILMDGTRQSSLYQFDSVKTWEFPLLVKYTLPVSRIKPFVEAGPSFRVWQDPQALEPSHYGITAGLGAKFNWGKLQFAPMVRYTRWARDGRFPLRATNPDQVELLGSVSYSTNSFSRHVVGHKLWVGLIAGIAPTSGFQAGTFGYPQKEALHYAAGVGIEAQWNNHLAFEVDGIYRPLHTVAQIHFQSGVTDEIDQFAFTVLTWEFPVLVKYRLRPSKLVPFLEAGPSFRASGNTNGYTPSRFGATAGIGVEAKAGFLRLAPTVRYIRWAKDAFALNSSHFDYTGLAPNQVELMVIVSF
jgi:hypothetical protein